MIQIKNLSNIIDEASSLIREGKMTLGQLKNHLKGKGINDSELESIINGALCNYINSILPTRDALNDPDNNINRLTQEDLKNVLMNHLGGLDENTIYRLIDYLIKKYAIGEEDSYLYNKRPLLPNTPIRI